MANVFICVYLRRTISTSCINHSMKNFNKFRLIYRGTEMEKKQQRENPDRNVLGWSHGVRHPGYWIGNRFVCIPEMIPEIIVPNLEDCEFLPYVSYRTPEIIQEEFTPTELFKAVYADKLEDDFANDKLDEDCNALEPSEEEKLTATEAFNKARQTGTDLFSQDRPNLEKKSLISAKLIS